MEERNKMSKELINSINVWFRRSFRHFFSLRSSIRLVDKLFSHYDRKDTPGCAIAIIKEGRLFTNVHMEWADLERDVPLTTKSVFDIGCTAKQFVAMCILLLSEKGKNFINR